MCRKTFVWLVALTGLALPLRSEEPWSPLPEGGESMVPMDSLSVLRVSGSPEMQRSEVVPVFDMPFDRAVRVTVKGTPRNAWDVQVLGRTTGDIRAGDVLLMSLFVRAAETANETGEGYGIAYLQKNSASYDKLMNLAFTAGSQWRQLLIPARMTTALPSGQHEITIFLGYFPQTVEIGGVSLVNYRESRTVSELPRTRIYYAGSEPDAPWRKEAADTIEKIRKSDIRVAVKDAEGNPLAGAEVRVKQNRHEFGFGSAVAADGIFATNDDAEKYRSVIREWFNKVVLENDLKWPNWERDRGKALNALAWLRDNGINRVRGHTLVWPGWSRMPSDVQSLASDPAALRARVLNHIDDELAATRGQLIEWDVINEPYTNTDVQKILGDGEMVHWFKKAREREPWAVLYINDYSILSNGGMDRAHQDHYYSVIQRLIDSGAPLDGIGMQSHFGSQLTSPIKVWQILDRFTGFGKQIHITEFDIDTDDEEIQAAYTRDFMTAIFSHPSVSGFMMWGFWEGRHWKPRAAMFRRDWSLKPNAQAFYDLVFNEWWTDVRGLSDDSGVFVTRGFKGDYDIEVTAQGKTATVQVSVDWSGSSVSVVLQ